MRQQSAFHVLKNTDFVFVVVITRQSPVVPSARTFAVSGADFFQLIVQCGKECFVFLRQKLIAVQVTKRQSGVMRMCEYAVIAFGEVESETDPADSRLCERIKYR